ncbi:hypothetical protein V6N11_033074 [Hibiscus sabdariffa]|uniref:Apple domain-containing protein n=1 Tax=Hibiscus sabdariffa TaxID=183260 RepID=A0ABR1Z6F7_9ROSI
MFKTYLLSDMPARMRIMSTSQDWDRIHIFRSPEHLWSGGFKEFPRVKFSASASDFNSTMNLEECEPQCLKKCSCTAYASSDVRYGGSGCQLWFGEMIDIKLNPGRGQLIYVPMVMSEIDETWKGTNKTTEERRMWIVVSYQSQSILFDWPMQHHIINGIACRLLYLHRDSLQRVIHRVLKAV